MTKTTRRAFLSSVVALVICLTMLIGTTFAWFTDTASTAVNTIQSGKLDVDIVDINGDSLEGETLSFVRFENTNEDEDFIYGYNGTAIEDEILWEPGCTYVTEPFTIVNKGNLALKYTVVVNGAETEDTSDLMSAIDWYIGAATKTDDEVMTLYAINDALKLSGLSDIMGRIDGITSIIPDSDLGFYVVLVGHMKEEAGNDYQGLTAANNISITVYATQDTYESDSIDNTYDQNATLPVVATAEELNTALTGSGDVNVALSAGTYTLSTASNKTVVIHGTTDTVIDMVTSSMTSAGVSTAGLDITFDGVTVKFNNEANYRGIQHAAKVVYENCVIEGKQFMYAENVVFKNCTFINSNDYCVWTYGAGNATFENCEFYTGGKAILIYTEDANHTNNVAVNNCKFYDNGNLDTAKAAIEIGDSQPTAGLKVNLTVNNNEIYGFANNTEGTVTGNKVWGNKNSIPADRLHVTASNNTEYNATVGMYGTAAEVANALKATTDIIDITLTNDVEVTVDSGTQRTNAFGGANTETITIDGLGTYTLTINQPDSDWSHVVTNGAKLVLKNLKLTNSGYNGSSWNQHDINFGCEVELDNVVSDKAIALYKNSTLNNVKITDDSGEVYGLWITADGQTVNLNNVEISTNRAIAIKDQYRVATSQKVTLNITDSKFTSAKKAAVLVTSHAGATITASNVDISGVAADSNNLVWADNDAAYRNADDITVTGATVIVEP